MTRLIKTTGVGMAVVMFALVISVMILEIQFKTVAVQANNHISNISTESSEHNLTQCQIEELFTGQWKGFDMDNLLPFVKYLESIGYDTENADVMKEVINNIWVLHSQALAAGVIMPLENDIILAAFNPIEPLWSGGDKWYNANRRPVLFNPNEHYSTHQRIAQEAFNYANARFPRLFVDNGNAVSDNNPRNALVWYTNWPDVHEDDWINNMHFYYYQTGTNYWRNIFFVGNENASTRFQHWYNMAVNMYNSNSANGHVRAFQYLGRALHYIADVASPPHTAERLAYELFLMSLALPLGGVVALLAVQGTIIANHNMFESYTRENIERMINSHIMDTPFAHLNARDIPRAVARISHLKYRGDFWASGSAGYRSQVAESSIHLAINATISVLERFALDVTETFSPYHFFVEDGTIVRFMAFVGFNGYIVIPEGIMGIGADAFLDWPQVIRHITLPSTIQYISPTAFGDNPNLRLHFADRTLLQNRGSIFVVAGGAPLFVTDWNRIGGFRPYINITDAQLRMMQRTPVDGTLVWESTTNTTYVFAGGAPLFISNMNISGRPVTRVDFAALFNTASYLSRVNQHPADGTLVWEAVTNTTYIFAGGAPLFVTNLDLIGGYRPSTQVDFLALFTPSSHLSRVRSHPMDGTFVTTMQGSIFRFNNGQAFRIQSWEDVGGIQHNTLVDEHAFAVYGRSEGVYVLMLNNLVLENWHLVKEFLLWEQQNLGWMLNR